MGPRMLMDWVSPKRLLAEHAEVLKAQFLQQHSPSSSSSPPPSPFKPTREVNGEEEGPPPLSLVARLLMFPLSRHILSCATLADTVMRGHPAPRRFLESIEYLYNRPMVSALTQASPFLSLSL